MLKNIVIIGGGASGFMAAITAAQQNSNHKIIILEKSREVLGKVKISGGGRCNVTNTEINPKKFSKNYPRGGPFLLHLFKQFDQQKTIEWFNNHGVTLKSEPDGRMFPTTNQSETIVDCLIGTARKNGVEIWTSSGVKNIVQVENDPDSRFEIELYSEEKIKAYAVLYATGGSPSINGYAILQSMGIQINTPMPSLFTFNVIDSEIIALAGLSVSNARVKILGINLENNGPLLITHWGFSGPAILKLSAWAAIALNQINYHFKILINWVNQLKYNELVLEIENIKISNPKKIIQSNAMFGLPARLWVYLCDLSEIDSKLLWLDISQKKKNKLIENIQNCPFEINGKSTSKEEFVTCGGVILDEVCPETLEAKKVPGLFFSGEILDIDAVTGGFNFQAAWTTGYIAGKNLLN
jgi:predicted Rossmann fold flavoprotein